MELVEWESAFGDFFEEWVGVELFDVEDTCSCPFACEEHVGSAHGWYASCVAYALCACFAVGCFVRTIIVNIICAFFAVFDSTNAASD